MSEDRMVMVVIVLLSSYMILVGSATPALLVTDTEGVYVPPIFAVATPYEPNQFANYTTFKINLTEFVVWYDLPYAKVVTLDGVIFVVELVYYNSTYSALRFNVLLTEFLGMYYSVRMGIYAPDGSLLNYEITSAQLDRDYSNTTVAYRAVEGEATVYLRFSSPNEFNTPSQAFNSGELILLMGVNPVVHDSVPTGTNFLQNLISIVAFTIDGRIPPLLAVLIFTPIISCGAYLVFWAGLKIIHG